MRNVTRTLRYAAMTVLWDCSVLGAAARRDRAGRSIVALMAVTAAVLTVAAAASAVTGEVVTAAVVAVCAAAAAALAAATVAGALSDRAELALRKAWYRTAPTDTYFAEK